MAKLLCISEYVNFYVVIYYYCLQYITANIIQTEYFQSYVYLLLQQYYYTYSHTIQ